MDHGNRLTYPIPMDQKLAQGDAFRRAKEILSSKLIQIEQESATPLYQHTKSADCPNCISKKAKIASAFSEYFVGLDGLDDGSWQRNFPNLRHLMRMKGEDPQVQQAEVKAIFDYGLKEHFKNDLCTFRVHDNETTKSLKKRTKEMFGANTPLSTILQFYLSNDIRAKDPKTAELCQLLEQTRTLEERAAIYVQHYCPILPSDSSTQRNFKQKYARIFESLAPHDQVVAAMRREADEYSRKEIEKLEARMSQLKMAQNAHVKNKQRKLERKRRGEEQSREQVVECAKEGCSNGVNLVTSEVIECAICEWLAKQGGHERERRQRAVYCMAEHAETDFVRPSTISITGLVY